MDYNKKVFCEGVRRLCESAGANELYEPFVQLYTLCEGTVVNNGNANSGDVNADNTPVDPEATKTAEVNWNNLPQEELDNLKADIEKSAEAKKAVTDADAQKDAAEEQLNAAKKQQTQVNTELANKLNATASQTNNQNQDEQNQGQA
jgi:hypothetical protein